MTIVVYKIFEKCKEKSILLCISQMFSCLFTSIQVSMTARRKKKEKPLNTFLNIAAARNCGAELSLSFHNSFSFAEGDDKGASYCMCDVLIQTLRMWSC